MKPPALSFANVRHDYRAGVSALDGVSLDVAPGEIVALLGPSGCGKTTLLRIGAGLERQSAGRVALNGVTMADERAFAPPEKRGVGLMFQDYALFPHLDVKANIAFGLARGVDAGPVVADLLRRIGLAGREHDYPHMLSGGEQQRVAMARAMAPRPVVLLMDEPFSNLDQRLRRGMRAQTVELLRENAAAAVLVTHDPDDAMAVADRIALMREGRIVQCASPEDIFRNPVDLFAARFFSELAEIPAQVRQGRAETSFGSFAARGLADGPALVCIRRDAFSLRSEEAEFAAIVRAVRFLGDRRLVVLDVDGVAEPIEALVDARNDVAIGEKVGVSLDRTEVFAFPVA